MSRSSRSILLTLALVSALGLAAAPARAAVETYAIDAGHSDVGFKIRHLVAKTTGGFNAFSGTIQLDRANLAAGSVAFEIDATSIDTNHEKRDAHLKSADFFAVDSFPKITFKSTKVVAKSAEELVVTGDLTMRGVTKPVDLTVAINGFGPDPWGNQRAGFEVTGKLDRRAFGILWNKDLDTGGTLLDDQVALMINIEAIQEKPEAAAGSSSVGAVASSTSDSATAAVESSATTASGGFVLTDRQGGGASDRSISLATGEIGTISFVNGQPQYTMKVTGDVSARDASTGAVVRLVSGMSKADIEKSALSANVGITKRSADEWAVGDLIITFEDGKLVGLKNY